MKMKLVVTAIAGLLMLATGRAEAVTLSATTSSCPQTPAGGLKLADIYELLDGCFDVNIPEADFKQLYKADGAEAGAYATSYNTTFLNTPQDPTAATIQYVWGTEKISCYECYLVVKAGNTVYFYELSGWNGADSIGLKDFGGPTYGAISNVAIYGVPEPATLLLLVSGLGLIAFRKRQQQLG